MPNLRVYVAMATASLMFPTFALMKNKAIVNMQKARFKKMLTVKYDKGDVLNSKVNMICHQTNYEGIMGAGIALQIKNKFPEVYDTYREYCNLNGSLAFTKALLVKAKDGRYIANLFGQRYEPSQFGDTKPHAFRTAYKSALTQLYELLQKPHKMTVAVPYRIACGIAGGYWSQIEVILIEVAKTFAEQHHMDIELSIIEWEGEQ